MDRSNIIDLIKENKTQNENGEFVSNETRKTVFCDVRSVSRAEWNSAGQMGYNPRHVVSMFAPDYDGEEVAELNGERFSVYRTFNNRNEIIELYLERKAGKK